ncbi:MAG: methyltransferase domain-containing protein [Desulfatibacillaceae bacterium]
MTDFLDENTLGSVEFRILWNSGVAEHNDSVYVRKVNLWRDALPQKLKEQLAGKKTGDTVRVDFAPGEMLPGHDPGKVFRVPDEHVTTGHLKKAPEAIVEGRFYPRGILFGLPGVFKGNMAPFRCVEHNGRGVVADLNHPLAGRPLSVEAEILEVWDKDAERGGSCLGPENVLDGGPGMQARRNGIPTDFFGEGALVRRDESPDEDFYEEPRLVHHIDETARGTISGLYGQLIKPGAEVLDLMSSWESHIPDDLELSGLHGLGMNMEELLANPRLTGYTVWDINADPRLPFHSNSFDAVTCTVSVEYLTNPLAVFDEVARLLRPGGVFAVAFSNRWFPPKAVAVWEDLHDFERMGFVQELFFANGRYEDVHTFSHRGRPRPENDRYALEIACADPVYAVWARVNR